jgi:hypothetical protein
MPAFDARVAEGERRRGAHNALQVEVALDGDPIAAAMTISSPSAAALMASWMVG